MLDSKIVRMELKYCECCGGLLLRRVATEATYCGDCAAIIREMAVTKPSKRRGRPPKKKCSADLISPVQEETTSSIAPDIQAQQDWSLEFVAGDPELFSTTPALWAASL